MASSGADGAERLHVASAARWRAWLSKNHPASRGVWLVFDRKGTTSQTLTYDEALDEALCWGWIDNLIKKIDDRHYMRKLTPRAAKSKWSPSNKERVARLTREGRMEKPGLSIIKAAKENGSWDRPDRVPVTHVVPVELEKALKGRPKARENFDRLAPSHRTRYIMWISTAKLAETRSKRAEEAAALLDKNMKPGLR